MKALVVIPGPAQILPTGAAYVTACLKRADPDTNGVVKAVMEFFADHKDIPVLVQEWDWWAVKP